MSDVINRELLVEFIKCYMNSIKEKQEKIKELEIEANKVKNINEKLEFDETIGEIKRSIDFDINVLNRIKELCFKYQD